MNPASLFLGTTPVPARAALADLFRHAKAAGYRRVVVPCVGRFSGPLSALAGGFPPDQIDTSDISLFSTLIGRLVMHQDPRELQITVMLNTLPAVAEFLATTADPLAYAAAVLFAQRLATFRPRHAHDRMVFDDLTQGWARHVDHIRRDLMTLTTKLIGVRYRLADVYDVVTEARHDAETILYIDPPGVANGYRKQFETHGAVTWDVPPIAQFHPRDGFPALDQLILDVPALALVFKAEPDDHPVDPRTIWAMPKGKRLKLLLANRAEEASSFLRGLRVTQRQRPFANPGYPVWGATTDRLQTNSRVQFTKVSQEVGLYYRDLFAHTLGTTDTEFFGLMWVDGKVYGTFGLHLQKARLGRKFQAQTPGDDRSFVWESYGFSTRHRAYRHLNRLLMMCLTCEEFARWLLAKFHFSYAPPDGLMTACITKGHESKGNRRYWSSLLTEISEISALLESGVNQEALHRLIRQPVTVPDVQVDYDWRTLQLAFLPTQMATFDALLDRIGAADTVGVADRKMYDAFAAFLRRLGKTEDIRSVGAFLYRMMEITTAYLNGPSAAPGPSAAVAPSPETHE